MQREGQAVGIEDNRNLREGALARMMANTGHFSQLGGIQEEWDVECRG